MNGIHNLCPEWKRARNRRVHVRMLCEVIVVAVLAYFAIDSQSLYVVLPLAIAAAFLLADVFYIAKRKEIDEAASIEVRDEGLCISGYKHKPTTLAWKYICVRSRKIENGRIVSLTLNAGGNGPDLQIEGYNGMDELDRILSERTDNSG